MALPCGPGRAPRNYGGPEETRPGDPRKRPWGRPQHGARDARCDGYRNGHEVRRALRHTDNDGDALTSEGVAAAESIRAGAALPALHLFGSTGAARATEMVEILRRGAGQEDVRVTVVPGLRSSVEDRWRAASGAARQGMLTWRRCATVDPDLVEKEAMLLGLRFEACSTPCPTMAARWSSATARPTRRCSAWRARWSPRWARAKASLSSRTTAGSGSAGSEGSARTESRLRPNQRGTMAR